MATSLEKMAARRAKEDLNKAIAILNDFEMKCGVIAGRDEEHPAKGLAGEAVSKYNEAFWHLNEVNNWLFAMSSDE